MQSHYTYRQTVTLDEMNPSGFTQGTYREVRDIIFSPTAERSEQMVGKPSSTLAHLGLTDEDFRDMRDIQPFLLTKDQAFLYETHFRGEETMDGVDCFVGSDSSPADPGWTALVRRPAVGIEERLSVIRSEGQAVPQIRTLKTENLFPHFTTLRQKVEGDYWFPVVTYGDDTLYFRGGAQRVRLTVRYTEYHRFGADSKITFDK